MTINPKTYTIFTTETCPFCKVAKNLIVQQGQRMHEVNLDALPAHKAVIKKAGFKSVPVIYLSDELIGGYENLREHFEAQGAILNA